MDLWMYFFISNVTNVLLIIQALGNEFIESISDRPWILSSIIKVSLMEVWKLNRFSEVNLTDRYPNTQKPDKISNEYNYRID